MSESNLVQRLGCYGKLPCSGDFFHRNLPSGLIQSWEHWLQQSLFHSQKQLGDHWKDYYLTCPFWRFYLPAGLIADSAYTGVMCPSVDSVGRYFPVTVLLELPPSATVQVFSSVFQRFLEHIEETILSALDQRIDSLDAFLEECRSIKLESSPGDGQIQPGNAACFQYNSAWQPAEVLSAWVVANQPSSHSWWWCEGNQQRPGLLHQTQGLPDFQTFSAMLCGRTVQNTTELPAAFSVEFGDATDASVPSATPTPGGIAPELATGQYPNQELMSAQHTGFSQSSDYATEHTYSGAPFDTAISSASPAELTLSNNDDDPLAAVSLLGDDGLLTSTDDEDPTLDLCPAESSESQKLRHESVYFSETGPIRDHNEDSILSRPDASLWVVADGMGGHSFGEFASQEITRQLSQLSLQGNLIEKVHQVQEALQCVNDRVLDFSIDKNITCGSTVVTALCEGHQFAVIWAGDSRLYRFRDDVLEQITRDHDGSELAVNQGASTSEVKATNLISRAVGVTRTLDTDIHYFPVEAGDRLLLCSDGVYGALPSHQKLVEVFNVGESLQTTSEQLQKAVLDSGADDNFSGVIIDILAPVDPIRVDAAGTNTDSATERPEADKESPLL